MQSLSSEEIAAIDAVLAAHDAYLEMLAALQAVLAAREAKPGKKSKLKVVWHRDGF